MHIPTVITSTISTILVSFYLHPIYVSVTEIEFDEKDKALEIMMRVNGEDLEATLRDKVDQPNFDIIEPENKPIIDKLVREYMKDHFKVTLDNKPQKVTYLGHERDMDTFVLYIQVSNVKKWRTIQVFNNILMEIHEDQSNLVHVNVGDEVRSLRLTKEVQSDKLTFE